MATAKKAKTEVATQQQDQLPDFLKGKMNDTRGSEEVGSNDLIIPRLELVQGLSAARKKNDPAYIPGAEEGMLYNNVTRELYGESVVVCPVFYRKEWLLWRDVNEGGGFGGAFPDPTSAEAAKNAQEQPDEWEVVDTNQHFVLLRKEDGSIEEAVLSMAKTKAKASRKWNSLIRINGGPRFSRFYEIKGIPDQNKAGQDFYNLDVKNVGFVDEYTFKAAEEVYNLVRSGKADVDHSYDSDSEDDEDSEM